MYIPRSLASLIINYQKIIIQKVEALHRISGVWDFKHVPSKGILDIKTFFSNFIE